MQNAGRILLMPKGDYSAGTTYTMLDLVNHGGASWVCKKDCTGQEPTDSNTEFWQRFGTAVDMSNYLQLTGGTVNGQLIVNVANFTDLPLIQRNSGGDSMIRFINSSGALGRIGFNGTNKEVGAYLGDDGTDDKFKRFLHSGNYSEYALPNTGGKLISNSNIPMRIESTSTMGSCFIGYYDTGGVYGYIGCKNGVPKYSNGNRECDIFHTGNKPTGTYTGNGSTVRREIATGGIGDAIVIKGDNGTCAFVYKGAVGREGATVKSLTASEVDVNDSILYLITNDACLNAEGVVYTYHVV